MTAKPVTLAERQRKAKRWREWEARRREREAAQAEQPEAEQRPEETPP